MGELWEGLVGLFGAVVLWVGLVVALAGVAGVAFFALRGVVMGVIATVRKNGDDI